MATPGGKPEGLVDGLPLGETKIVEAEEQFQFEMPTLVEPGRAPTDSFPTYDPLDPMKADRAAESNSIRELPGEAIDERTQTLQLSATDLVLPGNGGIDMVVSRSRLRSFFIDEDSTFNTEQIQSGTIGDWDLDIPRIEMPTHRWFRAGKTGVHWLHTPLVTRLGFPSPYGFGNACTRPFVPPVYSLSFLRWEQNSSARWSVWKTDFYTPNEWSALDSFAEPKLAGLGGGGSDPLVLVNNAGTNPWQYGAYASPGQWTASCVASRHYARLLAVEACQAAPDSLLCVYDGTASVYNEGDRTTRLAKTFEVKSPNGLTYLFDEPTIGTSPNNRHVAEPRRSSSPSAPKIEDPFSDIPVGRYLPEKHATTAMRIFVSEIRDKNGNWIKYEYDDSNLTQTAKTYPELRDYAYVKRIYANDGREINFEWECNPKYFTRLTLSLCPTSVGSTPAQGDLLPLARPAMRLKAFSANRRRWEFKYNDNFATTDASYAEGSPRFLSTETPDWHVKSQMLESVKLPDGRSFDYSFKFRLHPKQGYCAGWVETYLDQNLSTKYGATLDTIDYQVKYPGGGTVEYRMAPSYRTARDGQGRWGCWYETSVWKRIANNADGQTSKNTYCRLTGFQNMSQSEFISFRFEPFRTVKGIFVGQGQDDNEWRSGLKEREEVYEPQSNGDVSCSVIFESLGSAKSRLNFTYKRGASFVKPGDASAFAPFVDDSIGSLRGTESVRSWIADVGTFETKNEALDVLMRPTELVELASVEGASGLKRAWHQEYLAPSPSLWNLGLMTKRCAADSLTTAPRVCVMKGGIEQGQTTVFDAYSGAPTSTTSYGRGTSFTYHADGELFTQTQTDPMGRQLKYEDYYRGVPRMVTLPATTADAGVAVRHETSVDYFGAATSTTNPLSKTTEYHYDPAGRLDLVNFPGTDDSTLGIVWSPDGRTKTTTRGNAQTVVTFDGFGRRLTSVVKDRTTGKELAQKWQYDAVGRVTFESAPAGSIATATKGTTYEYDALDRVTKTIRSADGAYSETTFQVPEKKVVRDFDGNLTTFEYRSFGAPSYEQLMKISMPYHAQNADGTQTPKTLVTSMERSDVQGTLAAASQGNLGETMSTRRYAYNGKKDLVAEFIPEFGQTVFAAAGQTGTWNVGYCHDGNGTVIGKSIGTACVSGSENVAHFDIDERGQTFGTNFEPGVSGSLAADLTAKFNRAGQLEETSKGGVTSRVYYNDRGTVRRRELRVDSQIFGIGFAYDGSDRLTSITYPSGRVYSFAIDAFGRPTSISNILNEITYYPNGAMQSMTTAQGNLKTDFTLDGNDRLKTIKTGAPGATAGSAVDLEYGYTLGGNPQTVTDHLRLADSTSLGYDAMGRLITTQYTMRNSSQTYRRGYDALGNVTFDQSIEFPNVSYAYNAATNRLDTVTGLGAGARSYSHDAFGNITGDGTRTFKYQADGTLSGLTAPSASAKSFTYDGAHRLVKETKGGKSVYRVYLGEDLLMDFDPDAKTYVEYVYLAGRLVGSRHVKNADVQNSDNDVPAFTDMQEFSGLGN